MTAILANELTYSIRRHFWSGRRAILRGVSLSVSEGEIFGFVGPNGAGKTTTIKALLGLLRPDAGRVELCGGPPAEARVRQRVGYMPEQAYFPDHLTARELLRAHGRLAGLSRAQARARTEEALARVGLTAAGGERLSTYSKGMLQRAGLAQALIGDPAVVILDEPMSGLDPIGRHDVRQIILSLRQQGRTVFFSTHILPDVEMICDRVAIIASGRTRRQGRPEELMGSQIQRVEVSCGPLREELRREATPLARRVEERSGQLLFETAGLDEANRLVDLLRRNGVALCGMQVHRPTLEQLFMRETESAGEEAA